MRQWPNRIKPWWSGPSHRHTRTGVGEAGGGPQRSHLSWVVEEEKKSQPGGLYTECPASMQDAQRTPNKSFPKKERETSLGLLGLAVI